MVGKPLFYVRPPSDQKANAKEVKAMLLEAATWEEASHWVSALKESIENAGAMADTLVNKPNRESQRRASIVARVTGTTPCSYRHPASSLHPPSPLGCPRGAAALAQPLHWLSSPRRAGAEPPVWQRTSFMDLLADPLFSAPQPLDATATEATDFPALLHDSLALVLLGLRQARAVDWAEPEVLPKLEAAFEWAGELLRLLPAGEGAEGDAAAYERFLSTLVPRVRARGAVGFQPAVRIIGSPHDR
jgi:hypothetical protein